MRTDDYQGLYDAAREAIRFSYSPYSKFRVSAAVLTTAGKVITGTNVENASYGLTICAERVAIFNAVSQGETDFVAIAVACDSKGECSPCGACRQVIMEFSPTTQVIFVADSGALTVKPIAELLPDSFGPAHLSERDPT